MKKMTKFVLALIGAGIAICGLIIAFGQESSIQGKRWDLMMIKEARVWKNLLVNYSLSDHRRYLPQRKAALEKILKEFPESQWVDDAALVLACEKASFENNWRGAISDLDKITREYPNGQTIVASWEPEGGCRFNEIWMMWQGGLVFLNEDGSIRTAKPFDKNRQIAQPEKEALAYFAHLERCPVRTEIMARLIKASIQYLQGNRTEAIATLEKIVQDSREYLAQLNRADRISASMPDGYYIRQIANRPEYRAWLTLIGYHEKQNAIDKAADLVAELTESCSKDGWLWQINRQLGGFYERNGLAEKAREQYQLSLDGLNNFKKDIEKRSQLVTGTDFPDSFWENTRLELEKKLSKKQISK